MAIRKNAKDQNELTSLWINVCLANFLLLLYKQHPPINWSVVRIFFEATS